MSSSEHTDLRRAKAELRQHVIAQLGKMSVEARQSASARLRTLLEGQQVWQQARTILFFAALPTEVDIWPLLDDALAQDKTVALPRFDLAINTYIGCQVRELATDLAAGRFGIREPVEHCSPIPLNRLDFVLVPGVAFDLHGRRLGRGRGFYDQMLAAVSGKTCGVAFDQQIVPSVPVEPHDLRLDCILTPTRWVQL